jgi:WhiB family redox-sensing transcriptional regulator
MIQAFYVHKDYPDFMSQGVAPCATMDPELYFPDKGNGGNKEFAIAKRLCFTCQYRVECLEWALEHRETGVWGGTTERERSKIRRTRRGKKS